VSSPPEISIDPSILAFIKRDGQMQGAESQTLTIRNSGELPLEWKATADIPWITLINSEGIDDGDIQVGINGEQDPGTYMGNISIKSNDRKIVVPVTLEVMEPEIRGVVVMPRGQ
jgi:hypothetical protein